MKRTKKVQTDTIVVDGVTYVRLTEEEQLPDLPKEKEEQYRKKLESLTNLTIEEKLGSFTYQYKLDWSGGHLETTVKEWTDKDYELLEYALDCMNEISPALDKHYDQLRQLADDLDTDAEKYKIPEDLWKVAVSWL